MGRGLDLAENVYPRLGQCWVNVCDVGPVLSQTSVYVLCLLDCGGGLTRQSYMI